MILLLLRKALLPMEFALNTILLLFLIGEPSTGRPMALEFVHSICVNLARTFPRLVVVRLVCTSSFPLARALSLYLHPLR